MIHQSTATSIKDRKGLRGLVVLCECAGLSKKGYYILDGAVRKSGACGECQAEGLTQSFTAKA